MLEDCVCGVCAVVGACSLESNALFKDVLSMYRGYRIWGAYRDALMALPLPEG